MYRFLVASFSLIRFHRCITYCLLLHRLSFACASYAFCWCCSFWKYRKISEWHDDVRPHYFSLYIVCFFFQNYSQLTSAYELHVCVRVVFRFNARERLSHSYIHSFIFSIQIGILFHIFFSKWYYEASSC